MLKTFRLISRTPMAFDAFPAVEDTDGLGAPKPGKMPTPKSIRTFGGKVVYPVKNFRDFLHPNHKSKTGALHHMNLEPVERLKVRDILMTARFIPDVENGPDSGAVYVRDSNGIPYEPPIIKEGIKGMPPFITDKRWFLIGVNRWIGGHNFNKGSDTEGKYAKVWPAVSQWEMTLQIEFEDPNSAFLMEEAFRIGGRFTGIGQKRTYNDGFGRFYLVSVI